MCEPQSVISGVPQDSVLGPLIFIVLVVRDIDKDISSDTNVNSFADATRATRGVTSVADTICLQEGLTKYMPGRTLQTRNSMMTSLKISAMAPKQN